MCLGRRSLRLLRKAITLPPSCGPPTPPDPTDIRPGRPLGRPYPAFCFCFVFWLSLLLGPAHPPAHAEPHASLSPGGSALGIPGRLLPRRSAAPDRCWPLSFPGLRGPPSPHPSRIHSVFLCLALFRFVRKWEGTHFVSSPVSSFSKKSSRPRPRPPPQGFSFLRSSSFTVAFPSLLR